MRGILIRSPYIEKILDGKKTWESEDLALLSVVRSL